MHLSSQVSVAGKNTAQKAGLTVIEQTLAEEAQEAAQAVSRKAKKARHRAKKQQQQLQQAKEKEQLQLVQQEEQQQSAQEEEQQRSAQDKEQQQLAQEEEQQLQHHKQQQQQAQQPLELQSQQLHEGTNQRTEHTQAIADSANTDMSVSATPHMIGNDSPSIRTPLCKETAIRSEGTILADTPCVDADYHMTCKDEADCSQELQNIFTCPLSKVSSCFCLFLHDAFLVAQHF